MRFGSVCSGIEAASAAFNPLGWEAAWFSEIEPFPCSVLAHHYPSVPNLGDMTTIRDRIDDGTVEAPDLLCGGTPCQGFSVAGLRGSLSDDRSNLALEFIRIADAIDRVRLARGKQPAWVLFENVPGIFSTKDNAFGCFLGGLCGSDSSLDPPADGWASAGVVAGPARIVAWRTLDAQFFGVAQRRRRVFVLALGGAGGWACADALLPLIDRLSGHPAPRRETRKGSAGGTLRSTDGGSDVDHAKAGNLTAFGGNDTRGPIDIATARNACASASGRMDFESETFLVSHSLRGEGFDASEDGTGRGTPLVPVAFAATDYKSGAFDKVQQAAPITTSSDRTRAAPILVFDPTQITSRENHSNPQPGDPCHTLAKGAHAPAIAFDCKASGQNGFGVGEIASTQRAMGHAGSHTNGGGHQAVAFNTCSGENKGFGEANASPQETHTVALLRRVRDAVGEEAFAQWGLGILDSLQSPEILRSALHGQELRPATFSRRWVVCCALGSPLPRSAGALQSLREASGEGCASHRWGLAEQHLDELGAYLSELPQPGAQAERFMRDLWIAAEGFGLLRNALSAVQETRRPAHDQRQPVRSGPQGLGSEPGEDVSGSGLHGELSRERVLRKARPAGEAGDAGIVGAEQERSREESVGNQTLQVRRLVVEECEFLQGFARGYTAVPHRGKPAADGNRYKALGNSWAVPVAAWVGRRIEAVEALQVERAAA